jgi:hypothetical protein
MLLPPIYPPASSEETKIAIRAGLIFSTPLDIDIV